jgi:hypothetical protein
MRREFSAKVKPHQPDIKVGGFASEILGEEFGFVGLSNESRDRGNEVKRHGRMVKHIPRRRGMNGKHPWKFDGTADRIKQLAWTRRDKFNIVGWVFGIDRGICSIVYFTVSIHQLVLRDHRSNDLRIKGKGRGSVVAIMFPERSDDKAEYSQLKFMLQLFPICSIP